MTDSPACNLDGDKSATSFDKGSPDGSECKKSPSPIADRQSDVLVVDTQAKSDCGPRTDGSVGREEPSPKQYVRGVPISDYVIRRVLELVPTMTYDAVAEKVGCCRTTVSRIARGLRDHQSNEPEIPSDKLSELALKQLAFGPMTSKQIGERIGYNPIRIGQALSHLREKGIVEIISVTSDRVSLWGMARPKTYVPEPEFIAQPPTPVYHRTFSAYQFGEPLPGRSALDMRRAEAELAAKQSPFSLRTLRSS